MPNIYQRSYSLGITLIVLPTAFLSAENYAGDFLELGDGSRALGAAMLMWPLQMTLLLPIGPQPGWLS